MTIASNIPLPVTVPVPRKLTGVAKEIYDTLPLCQLGDSFLVSGNLKGIRLTAGKIAAKLTKELTTAGDFSVVVAEEGTQIRVWRVAFVAKAVRKAKVAA